MTSNCAWKRLPLPALFVLLVAAPADGQESTLYSAEKSLKINIYTGVVFSPDGSILAAGAAGSSGGCVVVWDLKSGQQKHFLIGHSFQFLRIKPDNKTLLVAQPADGTVIARWDMQAGRREETKLIPDVRYPLGFSHDGKFYVGTLKYLSKVVKVWDLQAGKEVATLEHAGKGAVSAGFSRDGKVLVTGGADRALKVWDTTTWKEKASATATNAVLCLDVNADGSLVIFPRLLMGKEKPAIRLWEVNTGKERQPLMTGVGPTLYNMALSPDGTMVATVGNNKVELWDVATSQKFATLRTEASNGPTTAVVFSPDNRQVAATVNHGVEVWKVPAR